MYDQGEALNMVVLLRQEAFAFPKDQIPDLVWRSNLFGRATNNLVLKGELQRAYDALDRELKVVGDIQRSLLPAKLPQIATLDLAAHYQPAQRAGGEQSNLHARSKVNRRGAVRSRQHFESIHEGLPGRWAGCSSGGSGRRSFRSMCS